MSAATDDWKLRTRSLTPPERETVVLMDDESDFALVTTWQRRIITKLEKNPAAEKLWEQRLGTSRGAQFRLPAKPHQLPQQGAERWTRERGIAAEGEV